MGLLNKIASLFIDVKVNAKGVKTEMSDVRSEVNQTAQAAEAATKKADSSVSGVARSIKGMFAPLNQLRTAIVSVGLAFFGWVGIITGSVVAIKKLIEVVDRLRAKYAEAAIARMKADNQYFDEAMSREEELMQLRASLLEKGSEERTKIENELFRRRQFREQLAAISEATNLKKYNELIKELIALRDKLRDAESKTSDVDVLGPIRAQMESVQSEMDALAQDADRFASERRKLNEEVREKEQLDAEQAEKEREFQQAEAQRAARQAIVDEAVARREEARRTNDELKRQAEEYWKEYRRLQAEADKEAALMERERQVQRLNNIEEIRRKMNEIAAGFEVSGVAASLERLADAVKENARSRPAGW